MKTPRDLILEKHRHADTKLASIRPEDLAAAARPSVTLSPIGGEGQGEGAACLSFDAAVSNGKPMQGLQARPFFLWLIAQNFWHESILPWRRVWAGLATVWLGIFVLNVASHGAPQTTVAKAPAADSRVVLAAWRERRQVLAQLLGPALPAAETIRPIPGPRSSLRVELMVV